MTHIRALSLVFLVFAWPSFATSQAPKDPLGRWRRRVKVAPVSANNLHSIHSYFNTCPESPDGRWVLYYSAATTTGHDGDIRILERATGKEKVLVRNVTVEDAHRVACQQWVCGGKRIVFHNLLKTGEWVVMAVELETGRERILARNRQVGFGHVRQFKRSSILAGQSSPSRLLCRQNKIVYISTSAPMTGPDFTWRKLIAGRRVEAQELQPTSRW